LGTGDTFGNGVLLDAKHLADLSMRETVPRNET
jgi:hypothetical protein